MAPTPVPEIQQPFVTEPPPLTPNDSVSAILPRKKIFRETQPEEPIPEEEDEYEEDEEDEDEEEEEEEEDTDDEVEEQLPTLTAPVRVRK